MQDEPSPGWRATRLAFADEPIETVDQPARPLRLLRGFGSGLAVRPGDPPSVAWAVGDRGPNIEIEDMIERYGRDDLAHLDEHKGAKVMPRVDVGPALAELRLEDGAVRLVRRVPLTGDDGEPISGCPAHGERGAIEPAFDLAGERLAPDPSGADTEGIVALADGTFWIGDEFGPSLLHVSAEGRVLERRVPAGQEALFAGARYPVTPCLPALAARRRLNRGFEALAASADERWLHLAFQSPLAHPDEESTARSRLVRVWRLDLATGTLDRQWLYELDPPEGYARDAAKRGKPVKIDNVKLSEAAMAGPDVLLLLERVSETTRIYRVRLTEALALPPEHREEAHRPTPEELDRGALPVRPLPKTLLFDSDRDTSVGADLEGMAVLDDRRLLLVNDNDFGVEGAETGFWLIEFDAPLSGTDGEQER